MKNIKKLLSVFIVVFLCVFIISCKPKTGLAPGLLDTPFTDQLKLTKDYEGKQFLKNGIGLVSKSNGTDGDTARFQYGQEEWFAVRFLCINTPESTINNAPWGKEASDYCKQKLSDAKEIVLEASVVGGIPEKDANARYLGYVWYRNSTGEDFRLLNLEMIEQCFTYYTGEVGQDTYGETFSKAFRNAYSLTTVDEEGVETKIGVFGQKANQYDYSTTVHEVTIAQIKENYSDYSTGTKLKVTVRVVRSVGNSVYVEDVEPTLNEDGISRRAGIFVYHSYKLTKNYKAGTILTFECQASDSSDYGKQLINPTKLRSDTSKTDLFIETIGDDVTSLKDYEGLVVKVKGFKITSIGTPNEAGAYTIYGKMENGSDLMVRVDADCSPILGSTSGLLKVGDTYTVTGGVSQYTFLDSYETVYQIKLGNWNSQDPDLIKE